MALAWPGERYKRKLLVCSCALFLPFLFLRLSLTTGDLRTSSSSAKDVQLSEIVQRWSDEVLSPLEKEICKSRNEASAVAAEEVAKVAAATAGSGRQAAAVAEAQAKAAERPLFLPSVHEAGLLDPDLLARSKVEVKRAQETAAELEEYVPRLRSTLRASKARRVCKTVDSESNVGGSLSAEVDVAALAAEAEAAAVAASNAVGMEELLLHTGTVDDAAGLHKRWDIVSPAPRPAIGEGWVEGGQEAKEVEEVGEGEEEGEEEVEEVQEGEWEREVEEEAELEGDTDEDDDEDDEGADDDEDEEEEEEEEEEGNEDEEVGKEDVQDRGGREKESKAGPVPKIDGKGILARLSAMKKSGVITATQRSALKGRLLASWGSPAELREIAAELESIST